MDDRVDNEYVVANILFLPRSNIFIAVGKFAKEKNSIDDKKIQNLLVQTISFCQWIYSITINSQVSLYNPTVFIIYEI